MTFVLRWSLVKGSVAERCKRLVLSVTSPYCSMASDGSEGRLVAVTQMTTTADKQANFDTCARLVSEAARAGAKMVFLPEGCDFIAESKEESLRLAESLSGPTVVRYKELARTHHVWLSLGGLHIREPGEEKMSNVHLLLDSAGEEAGRYTKTHLFSVYIPSRGLHLREDTYVMPGSAIHPPTPTPVGNLALGVCYDMRFAEFGLLQRQSGAEILTFSSAFTVTTGLAHWEALLRARAIETQCYVVAAAQTGQHNKKRSSYGHAMIADPWGAVVCQTSEGTGLALGHINLLYLHNVRSEMPVMSHRRHNLYHITQPTHSHIPSLISLQVGSSSYVSHQFGSVQVPGSCVFLRSPRSLAFVNKKPVAPGHVLVCPERPAPHLSDMTPAELSDLVQLTQATIKVIGRHYTSAGVPVVQMTLQDGAAAGQTIQHVHFHIIPLTPNLMEGEGGGLQGHEEKEHHWREVREMEKEAGQLRGVVERMLTDLSPKNTSLPRLLEEKEEDCVEATNIGLISVPQEAVFIRTRHSFAFVAPGPVLRGHVYIASIESEEGGYSGADVACAVDLLLTAQLVQGWVEAQFGAEASTVSLIDSATSSQPVLIQIIPRKKDDLPNSDDIYAAIYKHQANASDWHFTEDTFTLAQKLRDLRDKAGK